MLRLLAGNRTFTKSALAVWLLGVLSAANAPAQKITAHRLHQLTAQEHPALLPFPKKNVTPFTMDAA